MNCFSLGFVWAKFCLCLIVYTPHLPQSAVKSVNFVFVKVGKSVANVA